MNTLTRMLLSFSFVLLVAQTASSVQLLSKEKALKRMFLTAESQTEETKTLSPAQLQSVKDMLGGKLYAMKKPAGVSEDTYTFHFGMKGGKKVGVAVIEEQEDKWGPLAFIIVLNPETGKVKNSAMMKYIDGRARNLGNRAFLKQYFGKSLSDPLLSGKDINAVSGATVSCDILGFMMKKVMALYKVLYLD